MICSSEIHEDIQKKAYQSGYDAAIKDVVAHMKMKSDEALAKSPMLKDSTVGPRLRAMNAWGYGIANGIERGEAKGAANE